MVLLPDKMAIDSVKISKILVFLWVQKRDFPLDLNSDNLRYKVEFCFENGRIFKDISNIHVLIFFAKKAF